MKLNKKTVISLIPKAVLLILLLVIINTQLTESVVTGTFEKGLVFSILALGIFISFRILDIPDLSVDGTFTLGVAVSVMQAFNGDPIKGILLSIVAGAIAGSVTGILITKLNVQPILAGIITMTALYSINLRKILYLQWHRNISATITSLRRQVSCLLLRLFCFSGFLKLRQECHLEPQATMNTW